MNAETSGDNLRYGYDPDRMQRRAKNEGVFRDLRAIYAQTPEVTCGDCGTVCCVACPEFYLLEYLNVWRHIRIELRDEALEARVVRRSLRWAFLSFFDPGVLCPFLEGGRCVIYEARPLNCRLWAVEDDEFYEKKSARAHASLAAQQAYFERHGLKPWKPLEEFILPRCREIRIHGEGERFSEERIVDLDSEVAKLHMRLMGPRDATALNFCLHFPGHVALAHVAPGDFDRTRLAIVREYVEEETERLLEEITGRYGGKLP